MQQFQLPQTSFLYNEVKWISQPVDHSQYSMAELHAQNALIFKTLKRIEDRISKQLSTKDRYRSSTLKLKPSYNLQTLEQEIKNNDRMIATLRKDLQFVENRKQKINQGLESKTIEIKFALERSLHKIKQEIKILKLEEHQLEKKLQRRGDPIYPENFKEGQQLEQQLRTYSVRYVRLLDRYNKSKEKVVFNPELQLPNIEILEEIYDLQLEEREDAQYKQYEGIVKYCQVLSHRNDSEHNKYHWKYTQKLKDLERVIGKLGQIDRAITANEAEIIESKKNIELMKIRLEDKGILGGVSSQSLIPRRESFSSTKFLTPQGTHKTLNSRRHSMVKLQALR